MKKKKYIEPSAIVRKVNLDTLLQTGSGETTNPLPGGGGDAGDDDESDARRFSGGIDVWED